jgi:hypothetical protein
MNTLRNARKHPYRYHRHWYEYRRAKYLHRQQKLLQVPVNEDTSEMYAYSHEKSNPTASKEHCLIRSGCKYAVLQSFPALGASE